MPKDVKTFLALGALSAAASLLLGAAAAHGPNAPTAASLALFQTALQYHQFHALGLMMVGLIAARLPPSRWLSASGWLMIVGTLLFSGNLYLRSLLDFHALHRLTPFGGGAFIVAWLLLAVGVMRRRGGDWGASRL